MPGHLRSVIVPGPISHVNLPGPAALTHARAQLSLGFMDQIRKSFTHKHSKRLTQMVACGG